MIQFVYTSGKPDAEKRGCEDCRFLQGAVSLWCVNKAAAKRRGTCFPGAYDCPQWTPMKSLDEAEAEEREATPWLLRALGLWSVRNSSRWILVRL